MTNNINIDELEELTLEGSSDAAYQLYQYYLSKYGDETNNEVKYWRSKAEELGYSFDTSASSVKNGKGSGPEKNNTNDKLSDYQNNKYESLTISVLREKCAQGDAFALLTLGNKMLKMNDYDNAYTNIKNAIHILEKESSNVEVRRVLYEQQNILGHLCEQKATKSTILEEKNQLLNEAFECYQNACELDVTEKDYSNLIRCYQNGIGCEVDERRVLDLAKNNVNKESSKSCYEYAMILKKRGEFPLETIEWLQNTLSASDINLEGSEYYRKSARYQLAKSNNPTNTGETLDLYEELNNLLDYCNNNERLAKLNDDMPELLDELLEGNAIDFSKISNRFEPIAWRTIKASNSKKYLIEHYGINGTEDLTSLDGNRVRAMISILDDEYVNQWLDLASNQGNTTASQIKEELERIKEEEKQKVKEEAEREENERIAVEQARTAKENVKKEKKARFKSYITKGIIALVLLVGAVGLYNAYKNRTITVDPFDYLTVESAGLNNGGRLEWKFNETSLENDLGRLIEDGSITFNANNNSNLKNGDEVTLECVISESVIDKSRLKMSRLSNNYTIEGLQDGTPVDVFENIEIAVIGNSGQGVLNITNNSDDEYLKTITYITNPKEGISNGDVVTIIAESDPDKDEVFLKYPKEVTMTYVVDGLAFVPKTIDEITAEAEAKFLERGDAIIRSNALQNNFRFYYYMAESGHISPKDYHIDSITIAASYYVVPRDSSDADFNNQYIVIYKIVGGEEDYETLVSYVTIRFQNIVIQDDIKQLEYIIHDHPARKTKEFSYNDFVIKYLDNCDITSREYE